MSKHPTQPPPNCPLCGGPTKFEPADSDCGIKAHWYCPEESCEGSDGIPYTPDPTGDGERAWESRDEHMRSDK